jgi:hypothetical protein
LVGRLLGFRDVGNHKVAGPEDEIGDPLKPKAHLKDDQRLTLQALRAIGEFSGVPTTLWQGRQQVDARYGRQEAR